MESPQFDNVQDELEFFKNSPPAQTEENENSMDPLKTLPEPCTRVVMEYLTAKELLTATEVSKYWKEFVESRSFLMNGAMDRIIVKPTIYDYSLPLIDSLFDDGNSKRPYKHMKSSLRIVDKYKVNARVINPIDFYAATLETLTIDYDSQDDRFAAQNNSKIIKTIDECNLPKLQKLILNDCWDQFILEDFLFPVLTHLRLVAGGYVKLDDLMKVLSKCPKLRFFHLASLNLLIHDVPSEEPALIDPRQPKIEIISITRFHPNFMRTQQDSLVKLEVDAIFFEEVALLLRDFKMLKSLTITSLIIEEGNQHFTRNESIEQLRIHCCSGDWEEIGHQDFYNNLQNLFLAIPSSSELTLFSYLDGELLKFLASNMRHLKTLICREYSEELLAAYEEIRNNPRQYVNPSFEFIADRNIDYEIRNEF